MLMLKNMSENVNYAAAKKDLHSTSFEKIKMKNKIFAKSHTVTIGKKTRE
jgi:hypothetical protein